MDELLEQFLVEAPELVEQAAEDLLALERDPADAARLESAFRAFHTLKGSVALFDLAPLGRVLHAAEDLLGAVREGRRPADRMLCDALLGCLDAAGRWIGGLGHGGALPEAAAAEAGRLEAGLRRLLAPAGKRPPRPGCPPCWRGRRPRWPRRGRRACR
ncbi:Hpt domain-containing protein [Paeniroseomonas aquatica]|uniref:Hpt domain-containing protein n=1 Tax=Paeniroseomonas aquatica TaxID=373043 RepID=UPI003617A920